MFCIVTLLGFEVLAFHVLLWSAQQRREGRGRSATLGLPAGFSRRPHDASLKHVFSFTSNRLSSLIMTQQHRRKVGSSLRDEDEATGEIACDGCCVFGLKL